MSDFNGKKRSELPDEVFGIPQERKYPMPDEKHTRSAIKLFNHVDPKYEEQLAKAVIKNMKKYNIDGSVVGPNNRLRKYLPKDMIKEYVEEACKDLIHARKLCNAVRKLARKYNANYFFVTDGASSYSNGNGKYNPAAKEMRDHMDDWERNNGFNPDDDWTNDINNVSNYRLLKESSILEGLLKSDFSYTGIKTSTEKSEFKRDFREVFKEDPTESSINYMQMIKYKGSLVGYIGFSRYKEGKKKYLGIGNFMILKRYQHSGIGSKVISDIIDRYKDNYDEIYCYVDKDNTSAIAFYKKIAKVNTDNLTKYGYYVTLYSKSIGESSIEEGFLKSDKDIYYNKDKFDSGEINLCFITGLSGSGKSTMGRNMSSKNIEHYEMDDIICNYAFSDDNLKEYGGLVESFFKGPGKEYRLKRGDEDHNNAVFDSHKNYEKEITQAFVKHAISYCKSHKGIKYVCDGIWIFMFIKPEQLKDCAVYIKGTSSIKSGYRALKRDIDEDKRNGMTSLQIFKHEFKRVKEDILYARENQKELKSFRSYFEKQLTNESYLLQEASSNKVYHLSQTNLDGKIIRPTVPSNYMTKNGYEDGKTKRVCFATSIDGCLRGLSLNCEGMKLFVHVPDGNYNIYKPSNKEVPDASITGEVWIKKAVKMKCIGQIYVIGDKGEDGIPYKYGDKTAELYDWEWKWIDKFNESSPILPQDTGISTIVFDIGNVLVSTNFKELLMGDPEIPNEIVDTLLKLWLIDKDDINGTINLKTYREIVNKRMGVEFSKYIPKLFKYNIECVNAFDYTIPMIQDLKAKGYKVYYLSNWSAWTHDLLIEAGKFEFLKYMDGGLFSYDAGYMKPDQEIYKLFIEKYKINPEQAVFFDDKEENVLAAKKLGFQAVQFTDHDSSIVYDYLKNNGAIYESIVQNLNEESHNNRSFNYKSIFENSNDITMEKFIFGSKVKVDMNKTTKEIVEAIKPIIFTSKNKQQASRIGLTLKCELEFVNHNTICILVLDGSQDARNSKEARLLLSNIQNDCKSKLVGYISKVTIGDGDKGCLYFTINEKYIQNNREDLLESAISEYGATAGTMVGTNQSDSVYIVNYMQNNAFSGYKEPKFGICRKGMKDLHVVGGKYNKFHYVHDLDKFKQEVSDIHVYRYKGKPRTKFFDIIEEMGDNDLDLYRFITGKQIMDRSDIKFDGNFIEEECFLYELDAIKSCTEASLISESEDLHAIPILNESVVGRPYNYYRDINGVFIYNEITNIRSKSYKSIEDIPESECNMVKRGYII